MGDGSRLFMSDKRGYVECVVAGLFLYGHGHALVAMTLLACLWRVLGSLLRFLNLADQVVECL